MAVPTTKRPDKVSAAIVDELRRLIKASPETYRALGELTGIHWTTIQNIAERRILMPGLPLILPLARALGTSLGDLERKAQGQGAA